MQPALDLFLIKILGKDPQIFLVLFPFAGELADENVNHVRQVNVQTAKITEEPSSLLPIRGKIVRLNTTQGQTVLSLNPFEDVRLLADFRRDLVHDINVIRRAGREALNHGWN